MSGTGGLGNATSYSTLRRGLKATTSKLMGATSVKRPPAALPPSIERGPSTERGDPSRFIEGVSFKGKLIGVLEVSEARGDCMCQEALAELKIAVRAAGEHKQRIAISVAMDGIRLTDERTGDCLYHHPVHKISFIAQDMSDTRAFGYIFGSPDAGHKFFGIKTEKAASQVVIAMRDLFQVVFERKKKEIEKARAQLEEGRDGAAFKEEHFDPFGDSFKPGTSSAGEVKVQKPPRITASSATTPAPLAPPPLSGRSRQETQKTLQKTSSDFAKTSDFAKFPVDFRNITKNSPSGSQAPSDRYAVLKQMAPPSHSEEDYPGDAHRKSIGSTASGDSAGRKEDPDQVVVSTGYDIFTDLDPLGTGKIKPFVDKKDFFNDVRKHTTTRRLLRGTGDGEEALPGGLKKVPAGVIPAEVSALVASASLYNTRSSTISGTSKQVPQSSTHTTPSHGLATSFTDSFERLETPGSGSVPGFGSGSGFADFNQFADSPRSHRSDFSSGSVIEEPASSLSVGSLTVALPPESFRDSPPPFSPPPPPHSPARSASESNSPQPPLPRSRLIKQTTVGIPSPLSPKTLPRSHRFPRQASYEAGWDSTSYFPPHREGGFAVQSTPSEGGISPRPRPRSSLSKHLSSGASTLPLRGSFNRGLLRNPSPLDSECRPFPREDTSLGYDEAPEPPPRPAHVEPPPLPPKRLPSHITLRPPPRPPPSVEPHYNYINEYDSSPDDPNVHSPPIPIPSRKPRFPDTPSGRGSLSESFQLPKASHSPTRDFAGAVPKTSSRGSTPSKSSTPGKSPRSAPRGLTPESVDLTNTSLDQLASTLNVPVEQLAKMTVVELAACLAQMQLRSDLSSNPPAAPKSENNGYEVPQSLSQQQFDDKFRGRKSSADWSASQDKFAFDDEEMFARFDAQFPKSPVDAPDYSPVPGIPKAKFPLGATVSEDRYAVFKELSTVNTGKLKSVFDENLLTPQNSMEEEVSEVSSGTFKANFNDGFHQDSLEQKSSISDDVEAPEINRGKDWEPVERIDHECVTVFRSPDISEYENFEPNFECKFEDNFSTATLSERSLTPTITGTSQPSPIVARNVSTSLLMTGTHRSPFTDDFSKVSNVTIFSEAKYAKISNDDKFVANFNDASSTLRGSKCSVYSESSITSGRHSRSTSEKSPFEDDFSEYHIKQRIDDSSLDDKYDNVFETDCERRLRRAERSSRRRSRKSSSLDAPNGSVSSDKPRSPFDDDFSQRTSKYEVLRDLDPERSSPFEDHEDQKSIGSLQSIQEEGRASSVALERRRSPYSETLTPPTYVLRSRGPSRVSEGSEASADIRQSPFEDNFNPVVENGPNSLIREFQEAENGELTPKDGDGTVKVSSLTVPPLTAPLEGDDLPESASQPASNFADFEHAFQDGNNSFVEPGSNGNEEPEKGGGEEGGEEEENLNEGEVSSAKEEEVAEDEEEVFPETETEFKVSARFPKTETETIFRRDSDPFSDDFFDQEPHSQSDQSAGAALSTATAIKESFWEEPFANFKPGNG